MNKIIAEQNEKLSDKKIIFQNSGSLAESSIALNGVFKAADDAAQQYLYNIKLCGETAEAERDRIIADAQAEAKKIIEAAEEQGQKILGEAQARADEINKKIAEIGEINKT